MVDLYDAVRVGIGAGAGVVVVGLETVGVSFALACSAAANVALLALCYTLHEGWHLPSGEREIPRGGL